MYADARFRRTALVSALLVCVAGCCVPFAGLVPPRGIARLAPTALFIIALAQVATGAVLLAFFAKAPRRSMAILAGAYFGTGVLRQVAQVALTTVLGIGAAAVLVGEAITAKATGNRGSSEILGDPYSPAAAQAGSFRGGNGGNCAGVDRLARVRRGFRGGEQDVSDPVGEPSGDRAVLVPIVPYIWHIEAVASVECDGCTAFACTLRLLRKSGFGSCST